MVNNCIDAMMGSGCVSHVVWYHGVLSIVMLNIPLHKFLSRLFALRICGAAFPILGGGGRMGLVSDSLATPFWGVTEVFREGEGTTRISTIPRGESLS